jgi:hypothetical protein
MRGQWSPILPEGQYVCASPEYLFTRTILSATQDCLIGEPVTVSLTVRDVFYSALKANDAVAAPVDMESVDFDATNILHIAHTKSGR